MIRGPWKNSVMAKEGLKDTDVFQSYERQSDTTAMVILDVQLSEGNMRC